MASANAGLDSDILIVIGDWWLAGIANNWHLDENLDRQAIRKWPQQECPRHESLFTTHQSLFRISRYELPGHTAIGALMREWCR